MRIKKDSIGVVVTIAVILGCFGIWRVPGAKADWRESYREGYREGYTQPGEDGIRGSNPTVPTPPTPRNAETD